MFNVDKYYIFKSASGELMFYGLLEAGQWNGCNCPIKEWYDIPDVVSWENALQDLGVYLDENLNPIENEL